MKTSNNCHIPRENSVEQKLSPSAYCTIAPWCSLNWHYFQVPFKGYLKFIDETDLWDSAQLKSCLLPFNLSDLKALLSAYEMFVLTMLHLCSFLMSSSYAALSRYASVITMYKLKTTRYFQY